MIFQISDFRFERDPGRRLHLEIEKYNTGGKLILEKMESSNIHVMNSALELDNVDVSAEKIT